MVKEILTIAVIFNCCISSLCASDVITSQDKTLPRQFSENKDNIPDWIKRTNFAIEAGTGQRPKYFLETIQPLLGTQDEDLVFFNQSRISEISSRPVYNLGLGLRKIFRETYLLGINSFYDYQDLHKHSRAGVGFEAVSDRGIEGRINTYIRISHKHLVNQDEANEYYEKVANGLEWEFGAPLPYLPAFKIYGGGNWYNFEHFKNKYGWQMRLEYTPIKYSRLDFIIHDDTKSKETDYRFEGAITFAFTSFSLADIIKDMGGSRNPYPKINLRDKTLERVVRDFDITVIKSTKVKATGLTVEGGRT